MNCLKIVVSDGLNVAAPGQRSRPKTGRVPAEWAAPYDEFRDRLDALLARERHGAFTNSKHVRMPARRGFGGCVKAALSVVATPYVLVLQHDRPCLRSFDSRGILAAMEASHGVVKYVGLPTKASLARSLPDSIQARCNIKVDSEEVDGVAAEAASTAGIRLRFLLFWYDSAHFCSTTHYRTFVFNTGRVPRGGFPEDSLGQRMHAEICTAAIGAPGGWREAHAQYGTFLYVDGGPNAVGHLKGRKYIESAELKERGWSGQASKIRPCGISWEGLPGPYAHSDAGSDSEEVAN